MHHLGKSFGLLAITAIFGLAAPLPAMATELVTNGGFETGSLSGWATSGPTGSPGSCETNWTVASSGGAVGCEGDNPGNPVAGSHAAYTANDGPGPLTYALTQTLSIPVNTASATLSFDWVADTADAGRKFSVVLGGITVFTSTASTNDVWTPETINVSSVFAAASGSTITLEFDNYIPGTYTGCCNGLGLDAVSLQTTAAPEPASIAILGAGLASLAFVRRRRAA